MQERKKQIALTGFYLKPQHTRKVLLVFVVECRWMAAIKSDIGKKQSNHWVGHIQNILYQDWGGGLYLRAYVASHKMLLNSIHVSFPSLYMPDLIHFKSFPVLRLFSYCSMKILVHLYIFVFAIHNRCWGVPLRSLYLASASILCWAALPMRLPPSLQGTAHNQWLTDVGFERPAPLPWRGEIP